MKDHQRKDVENVAYDILTQSKAIGVFPTPVDRIVKYSELRIDTSTDLSVIPKHYISHSKDILLKALRAVRGALDRRKKIIYLDVTQGENRKKFVKLHEIGHEVLPWQKQLYEYLQDDDATIDSETKEDFEQEANHFASSALFQLDRFEEEASNLPLEINTPIHLSKRFGSSSHAALRKYVITSKKRCALLILEKPESQIVTGCKVRNYFQSESFTKTFGQIAWLESLGMEWPFLQDYLRRRRLHTNGQCVLLTVNGIVTFHYHYFYNTFNAFILILPVGEKNKSRTKFIVKS